MSTNNWLGDIMLRSSSPREGSPGPKDNGPKNANTNDRDGTSSPPGLVVHTIAAGSTGRHLIINDRDDDASLANDCGDAVANDAEHDSTLPEMKRPRNSSSANSSSSSNRSGSKHNDKYDGTMKNGARAATSLEQLQLVALATSAANFLVSDTRQLLETKAVSEELKGGERKPNAANASSNESSSSPLEYFQRPGGVMYLVMSLVSTRGVDTIQTGKFLLLLYDAM